jgi:hypothetical protein
VPFSSAWDVAEGFSESLVDLRLLCFRQGGNSQIAVDLLLYVCAKAFAALVRVSDAKVVALLVASWHICVWALFDLAAAVAQDVLDIVFAGVQSEGDFAHGSDSLKFVVMTCLVALSLVAVSGWCSVVVLE